MNKTYVKSTLIALLFGVSPSIFAQTGVAINLSGSTSANPAILDLSDPSNAHLGFLMTNVSLASVTDAVTIPAPTTGMIVWNTNGALPLGVGYYYWTGIQWNYLYNSGTAIGAVTSVTGTAPIIITGTPTVPNVTLQGTNGGVFYGTGAGAAITAGGAQGSMLYNSAANTPNWLSVGTNGTILISNGTVPTWLPVGTNGQILTLVGGVPTWQAAPAAGYPIKDSAWTLFGNAGTNPSTNFMGTTDNEDVVFKRNNVQSGLLNNALSNTSWGVGALNPATTGSNNTAIGYQSLAVTTTGSYNVAIGLNSLNKNNTGQYNTASGWYTMYNNTSGQTNTATGSEAMEANTTGGANTATGWAALTANTTGGNNTAMGEDALYFNVAGNNATAIGFEAMFNANNTATTFADANVALGYQALYGSATPSSNTGNNNTALGYQTLYSTSNGADNTAVGTDALYNNQFGNYNTAIGWKALYSTNGTGSTNIGIGPLALQNNTTGSLNIGIGYNALGSTTIAYDNVAIGAYSLVNNTTGTSLTALGYEAGYNSTGSKNVFLGDSAGYDNTSGTTNTFVGYHADANAGAYNNATAVGYNSIISASNQMVLGSTNVKALVFNGDLEPGVGNTGTTGQVLTSQGAGFNPTWTTIAAGGVTAANDGTSLNGTTVILGGAYSSTLGELTQNTEIPFNGNNLTFSTAGAGGGSIGIDLVSGSSAAQALEIGQNTNTIRVDGLTAGSTFNVTPSTTNNYMVYANTNGDLYSIPSPATDGYVLTWSSTSGPSWQASAGGGISSVVGTSPVVVSTTLGTATVSLQGAAGTVAYGTGGGSAFTAVGTAPSAASGTAPTGDAQVLVSQGTGAPTWVNAGGVTMMVYNGLSQTGTLYNIDDLGTVYFGPMEEQLFTAAGENYYQIEMPKCVVTRIRVAVYANTTGANKNTFTVRQNGVNTALSDVITANVPAGTVTPFVSTGAVTFNDGDLLSIQGALTATGTLELTNIQITYYVLP